MLAVLGGAGELVARLAARLQQGKAIVQPSLRVMAFEGVSGNQRLAVAQGEGRLTHAVGFN